MVPAGINQLERITYQPGDKIFAEGDTGDRAYIVESGIVEISRDVGGKKMTLGTIEKNGIFGEMALIDEATRIASATAMIETVCIPVPKQAIQAHLASADPLLRKLVQVLLSNARSLSDHITRVIEEDK
jgi:CRP/FNR family cyclic AMP-dependent transcriptional regulator